MNPSATDNIHSMLHINIRSLIPHIDLLHANLAGLSSKFSVIAITETWTTELNEQTVTLPGYDVMIKSRKDARGGGIGLLFDSSLNLNIKARPDLACEDTTVMESMFVQLPQKNSKDIIIGVIYRPPNTDVNLFLSALAVILEVINSENRSCYLAGDFNIDLLNCKQHHGQSFLDQLFSFGFYPRIDRPTRITDTSATLIDNIFTNVHNSELTFGVWIADVSDHLPVYVIMPCLNRRVSREPKYVYKRIYSEDKMIQFRDALCGIDWSDIRTTIYRSK